MAIVQRARITMYHIMLSMVFLLGINFCVLFMLLHRTSPKPCGQRPRLPLCPVTPLQLGLGAEIMPNLTLPYWPDLEAQHHDLLPGGKHKPVDCQSRHNVAIVVPYRDREIQLLLFLQHIHPFLKRQKIAYTIYVLEQTSGTVFNRGLDRNIGFVESQKLDPTHDCTMFHDVDLLPLHESNMYTCPDQPRHVCVAVNYIHNFMPLYNNSFAEFGHVVSLRNDQYQQVNGYSNVYLGWGAEDDDLHSRIKSKGMKVYRYPDEIGKYYGIPHMDESKMPRPDILSKDVDRFKLLRVAQRRMHRDGLNNLKYKLLNITKESLFTRIVFDVEETSYAKEAIAAERMYKQLYGNLSPHWKKSGFQPPPYWWKHL